MAADNPRIDELRRRVQQDPASMAFAQLAEECRRSGEHDEAVRVCRAGLELHPTYLSARVTLGRALMALGQADAAAAEFELVLQAAPDNLVARRSLAELGQRGGTVPQPAARTEVADRPSEAPRQPSEVPPALEGPPPGGAPPAPEVAPPSAPAPTAEVEVAPVPAAPAPTAEVQVAPVPTAPAPSAEVQVATEPTNAQEPVDPLLLEMEAWLAEIRADRATRETSSKH